MFIVYIVYYYIGFVKDVLFPIYCCRECTSMQSFQAMRMDQRKADLQDLQCIHSKAMGTFYPDWEDHWIVNDVEATDMSYRVYCNQEIWVQTLLDDGMFLSAIQTEGDVTLLFTVKRKQKYPLCSK